MLPPALHLCTGSLIYFFNSAIFRSRLVPIWCLDIIYTLSVLYISFDANLEASLRASKAHLVDDCISVGVVLGFGSEFSDSIGLR